MVPASGQAIPDILVTEQAETLAMTDGVSGARGAAVVRHAAEVSNSERELATEVIAMVSTRWLVPVTLSHAKVNGDVGVTGRHVRFPADLVLEHAHDNVCQCLAT